MFCSGFFENTRQGVYVNENGEAVLDQLELDYNQAPALDLLMRLGRRLMAGVVAARGVGRAKKGEFQG